MRAWKLAILLFALGIGLARADIEFELHVLQTGNGFGTAIFDAADINKDGQNDIIGAGSPRIYWLTYPDLTNRHAIATSTGVGYEIHAGDIDNDGDLDVACSGGGMCWFENPLPGGDPESGPWKKHAAGSEGTSMVGGSHDFKIGDIDGDGKIDMVERDQGWNRYIVYWQKSPDSWDIFNVSASQAGEGTALGDVDLDGDLDISDGWAWFECPGSANDGTCNPKGSWTQHNVGDATHHLTRAAIADINEDGRPDILSCPSEFGGNALKWFEAPEDPKGGGWQEHVLVSYGDPNFHTLQAGDIDLDGHTDIYTGSTAYHMLTGKPQNAKLMWIFYNVNGDGSDWEEQKWQSPGGVWQGVLRDVGSDGDLDILTADYNGGNQSEFWENKLDPPTAIKPVESRSGDALAPSVRIERTHGGRTAVRFDGDGTHSVAVVDMTGRELGRVAGTKGQVRELPHRLAGGAYLLVVSSGGVRTVHKVLLRE